MEPRDLKPCSFLKVLEGGEDQDSRHTLTDQSAAYSP